MVYVDSLKLFKISVLGVVDDNLYWDDDNDNMMGGEELYGDGEIN